VRTADNLSTFVCRLPINVSLKLLEPSGPVQAFNGKRCTFTFTIIFVLNAHFVSFSNIRQHNAETKSFTWAMSQPLRTVRPIHRTRVPLPSRCCILYIFFNKYKYWVF